MMRETTVREGEGDDAGPAEEEAERVLRGLDVVLSGEAQDGVHHAAVDEEPDGEGGGRGTIRR